jgi:cell volume regulation protein A
LPFRFRAREILFVGWVGLRGAVPIILAILPMLDGVPEAARIFDVVFFIVVVNAIVPGATVPRVARWLRVDVHAPPPPAALLEIASTLPLKADVHVFYIRASAAAAGARLDELPLPADAAVVLILRGDRPVVPAGDGLVTPGDHVFVLCRAADRAAIGLLFGREEE